MMKEKTCVYIGIFLILALLCSCAMFYTVNGVAITDTDMSQSAINSPISMMLHSNSAASGADSAVMLFYANGTE